MSDEPKVNGTPAPVQQPVSEVPRKRGRPSNEDLAKRRAAAGIESPQPKVKTDSKPSRRKARVAFDDAMKITLAGQIMGLHALTATVTGIPEFHLKQEEAIALSNAVAAVCEEYNLSLDGKTGALLQLAATAAMLYTPRYLQMRHRIAQALEKIPGEVKQPDAAAAVN